MLPICMTESGTELEGCFCLYCFMPDSTMQDVKINLHGPQMIDRFSENFSFHQTALNIRQQRQEVLAANIANADTPGFKARDIRFRDVLELALNHSGRLPDTSLVLTSSRHIPAVASTPDTGNLMYRTPAQPRLDGNTVDMDVERVQFADNTMRYQTELAVLSTRLKGMMAALQQ